MSALNTIEFASVLQNKLDQQMVQNLATGWMDANAGQVRYNGGNEIKIPTIATTGLGDYKRGEANGYNEGKVTFKYKTYEMTQDRAAKFNLDEMDVDETNYQLTIANVMNVFQRESVIPEVDAYRLSKVATAAMSVEGDACAEYGYTVANATIINKIKLGIKKIREAGYAGQLIVMCTYDVQMAVEEASLGKLAAMTFSQGGINTQVPQIDGCPLLPVPQNRLYSAIKLNDGVSTYGYEKGVSAKDVNFLVIPVSAPIAVTKQDKVRIFDPNTNQAANGWAVDYRRYHDLWVLESNKKLLFANIKDTKE